MKGDLALSSNHLSGTLGKSNSLSGTLGKPDSLSGVLSVGLNPSRYYTKEEIDEIIRSATEIVVSSVSYMDFPVIGDATKLYIDTTANKIYRWDDSHLKYYCVGSNYNEIGIINGSWE